MKKKKHILVVTYWSYTNALIKTYTLPYLELISDKLSVDSKLYLLTLTPSNSSTPEEYELQKKALKAKNIELINFNYQPFGFGMLLKMVAILIYLWRFIYKHKIDCIHGWCTPGGAIGYVLSVITGKPLILDSFEPHAESMIETHTWKKNSVAYRLLFKLEKLQLKRASEVICAAEGMISYSQEIYGVVKKRYFIKPACVDLHLFSRHDNGHIHVPEIDPDSVVCVYAGKFGGIYLTQEVFDFFMVANTFWKGKFKVLLLTNQSDEEIRDYCENSGLPYEIIVKRFVSHQDVPKYMALGDFGICPVKPVPTKRFCTPIKDGEYWAMGLPVVITQNISTDSDLINAHEIGYVLKQLNATEYVKAVEKLEELIKNTALPPKIRAIAEEYRNFSIADRIYETIYA